MRVLLTTDTVGGVWTFTRELTDGLLQQGHSVALVSFGRFPSPEQTDWASLLCARHGDDFAFFPYDIPLEWMPDNHRALPEGDAVLAGIIDRVAPDLLHLNQFCFGALPCSLPRLVTAHSDVLSWAEACRPHALERSPWLSRYCDIVQRGLNAAGAVVAPTHAMLDALGRNFHLAAPRHVIPNGRSLPPLPELPRPRRDQAVTVGRLWDEAKGISLLTHIASPVPLVVAGEQSFDEQHMPLDASKLHYIGALTESQLFDLFRSSAIYIAPSIYEPFGLAPLEAALCGCAIVASDLPSLREVWGDAALFFSDGSSLEHHLQQLAHNTHALIAAQQRAQQRALTFSRDMMVARYLGLYGELCQDYQDGQHEDRQGRTAAPADPERQRVA